MIAINLLPEEFRRKEKKLAIDIKYLVLLVPAIVGVLLCIHISLALILIARNSQLGLLNAQWQRLAPQRQILEKYRREDDVLMQDTRLAEQLKGELVRWSEKLNSMSLYLPQGVWFNKLSASATSKEFVLKGAVVSLQKDEMGLINKLLEGLKADGVFFNNFTSLELESVTRDAIGGYDVVSFTLKGKLR